jgi:hypothetical protein
MRRCKASFYSKEEYAKRLIGNSFSIPTVEFLLAPIKSLFAERDYTGYSYQFIWEQPERGMEPPVVADRVQRLIDDHAVQEVQDDHAFSLQ